MKENNNVFLLKVAEKIKRGDYDQYFTIPFMSQELLLLTVKTKFERKLNTGGTPILNDAEIKDCINETKEAALMTFITFVKKGFIEVTEDGYNLTEKGELALKTKRINK